MIFKKPLLLSVSFVGLLGILVVTHFLTIRAEDRALYKQIAHYTKALNSTQSLERNPATQMRKGARKDIWTSSGGKRTHFQLHSDLSKLLLKQKKDKVEASEELENITCENITGKFIAKQGAFEYQDQHFSANDVTCTHPLGIIEAKQATLESDDRLILNEGVQITSEDFSIRSQKAICEAADKNQQIEFFQQIVIQTVRGVEATGDHAIYKTSHLLLYPESPDQFCTLKHLDHVLSAKEMDFDLQNEIIHCLEPEGTIQQTLQFSAQTLEINKEKMTLSEQVHLQQQNMFTIDADFCEMKDHTIEIANNVRFFSHLEKETFALADLIIYHPKEQTLIFKALAPKRVLVWQEGIQMSAPEIHIQKQLIQGIGDVRFTFNLEEEGMIDKQISKYLYIPYLSGSNSKK